LFFHRRNQGVVVAILASTGICLPHQNQVRLVGFSHIFYKLRKGSLLLLGLNRVRPAYDAGKKRKKRSGGSLPAYLIFAM
jgi:hypothetical protein